jgi:hypothetical protein
MVELQNETSVLKKTSVFLEGLLCAAAVAVEKPGDDPLQWLRDSIPGEPGVDYPIYNAVESTAFSCEGKVFGGKGLGDFVLPTYIAVF